MVENSEDIWAGDLLGRIEDAEILQNFLVNRVAERAKAGKIGSYVINVDAEWGQGKSFFMERLYKQLAATGYPALFINAWKDDFSDDPFTAVISEFDAFFDQFRTDPKLKEKLKSAYESVISNAGKIFWMSAKGGAKRLGRWAVGEAADEITEVVAQFSPNGEAVAAGTADVIGDQIVEVTDQIIDAYATKKISEFKKAKDSLTTFQNSLDQFVEALAEVGGRKLPLFVMIDELDRCRPTYAISMLERIKHLFDVANVVFVVATDTKQLSEAIKAVYGRGFDSSKYLQRFFHRSYELPRPSREKIVDYLFSSTDLDIEKMKSPGVANDHRLLITGADSYYGLSIRELEQSFDILHSVVTVWDKKFPIILPLMFPLIVGYVRKEEIDDFTNIDHWLAGKNNQKPWSIRDQGYYGHQKFDVTIKMVSLIRRLRTVAALPFHEFLEIENPRNGDPREAPDTAEMFVRSAVRDEHAADGNLVHNRDGSPRMSLMLRYPELIKRVGALTIGS